jgi:hypothetical protein
VRRFLPDLIGLICDRRIDPGRVFDLTLPLEEAAEGYRATDERRAIDRTTRAQQRLELDSYFESSTSKNAAHLHKVGTRMASALCNGCSARTLTT